MKFVKVYPFHPDKSYSEDVKQGLIINLDHITCIHAELVMTEGEMRLCYVTTISHGQFLTAIRTLTCPVEYTDKYGHP